MDRALRNAKWFRITVWVGILGNTFLFLPALIAPTVFAAAFHLGFNAAVWLPITIGLVLLAFTIICWLGARDPLKHRKCARWAKRTRLVQAIGWLLIAWLVASAWWPWCALFTIDLVLTVVQTFFLHRAFANAPIPA